MKSKFSYILKSIKLVENWYLLPAVYLNLLSASKIIIQLKNKTKIVMRTKSTDIHVFANIWLNEEYKIDNFESKKPLIIDIGAHCGYFALYYSYIFPDSKMLCFEPVKNNFMLLLENLEINKKDNIKPFNLAVTNSSKDMKIFLKEDDAAHNLYEKSNMFEHIKTISLKEIIDHNEIKKCDLLKLDCEGAEYDILNSLPDEYFNKIQRIILEYHIRNKIEFENLKQRFENLRYTLTSMPTSANLGIIFAEKNSD